jgi:hypothetical protein
MDTYTHHPEQAKPAATGTTVLFFPNVVSLLRKPYALPHYVDKRGRSVTFFARAFLDDPNEWELVEVSGTAVVFDLVLHKQIDMGQPRGIQSEAWAISEPATGCLIVSGQTRQSALDALAMRVAYFGGEDHFRQALENSVRQTLRCLLG